MGEENEISKHAGLPSPIHMLMCNLTSVASCDVILLSKLSRERESQSIAARSLQKVLRKFVDNDCKTFPFLVVASEAIIGTTVFAF